MKTKPQDLLPLIQKTAIRAGEVYEKQGQAFEHEHMGEAKLLEGAIALAAPGLESLVSHIPGTTQTLVELIPGVGQGHGGLFLSENGNFYWREREDLPLQPQTSADVVDGWELHEILRALAHMFQKQIAGREPSTTAATRRAERLEALAKLVE